MIAISLTTRASALCGLASLVAGASPEGLARRVACSCAGKPNQGVRDSFCCVPVAVELRGIFREAGIHQRRGQPFRIASIYERVGAGKNGVDPLCRRPERDARYPQPISLFLQATGVCYDTRRSGDQRKHLEITERFDCMKVGRGLDAM